jgi:hypothetical protein
MKTSLFILASAILSQSVIAETFSIPLNKIDQSKLARELAKLDSKYKSQEVVNENTNAMNVLNKYSYLDESKAFSINCSERFVLASTVGIDQECSINFNYALSDINSINVHDGFMDSFAIAEIKDQTLARDLYKSIGNGVSPSVFFNSQEYVSFVHPTTGAKFNAARLRIDCTRDASFKTYSCIIGSVK